MQSARWRRHLLGALALILLVGGVLTLVSSDQGSARYVVASMAWRMGLTLSVLWLALPQVLSVSTKVPPRVLVAVVAGGLIVAARPRAFPLVLLGLLALALLEAVTWLLRPQPRRGGRRHR